MRTRPRNPPKRLIPARCRGERRRNPPTLGGGGCQIFQERLYCIQWIKKETIEAARQETWFAAPTEADLERERSGVKRLQRGQEIPIAVLVRRVILKRRLDLAAGVQGALPALARAIERELGRL